MRAISALTVGFTIVIPTIWILLIGIYATVFIRRTIPLGTHKPA